MEIDIEEYCMRYLDSAMVLRNGGKVKISLRE
jgi:hypothetical protein